jgi:hypothetical protein
LIFILINECRVNQPDDGRVTSDFELACWQWQFPQKKL